MRFKAQIDGVENPVAVSASGALSVGSDSYRTTVTLLNPLKRRVTVGEKSFEVRLVDVDSDPEAGKYLFELNGELVTVMVSDVSKGGELPSVVPQAKRSKPRSPLDSMSGGIAAPMPGKIVNILVKPGDKVEPGQVVVILEAMKMENELTAINKGTVNSLAVEVGDSVQGGQVLVILE
jgi:biotin carboxyl carrier protein